MTLNVMFFIPYVIMMLLSRFFNRLFKKQGLSLRTIDLLLVYFFIGIHAYSVSLFEFSILPYFLILLSVLGIILSSLITFRNRQRLNRRFFLRFTRVSDLLSLGLYTVVGIMFFIK